MNPPVFSASRLGSTREALPDTASHCFPEALPEALGQHVSCASRASRNCQFCRSCPMRSATASRLPFRGSEAEALGQHWSALAHPYSDRQTNRRPVAMSRPPSQRSGRERRKLACLKRQSVRVANAPSRARGAGRWPLCWALGRRRTGSVVRTWGSP